MNITQIITYVNFTIIVIMAVSATILFYQDAIPIEFVTRTICDNDGNCYDHVDAISVAVQLGRLDLVSISLAIIGVAFAFFAIFGFLYIRDRAEFVAIQTVNEKWEYWQSDVLPGLVLKKVEAWKEVISEDITDESADQIADATGKGD